MTKIYYKPDKDGIFREVKQSETVKAGMTSEQERNIVKKKTLRIIDLDFELNKFSQYCLLNRIKFNDSNQIAQIVIDYLK